MSSKEAFKVEDENGKETCRGYGIQGIIWGASAQWKRNVKGLKTNVKCERINDNFLSAQEYASGEDRKKKFNNVRDEDDESVADMMIELQRGANPELDRNLFLHSSPTSK